MQDLKFTKLHFACDRQGVLSALKFELQTEEPKPKSASSVKTLSDKKEEPKPKTPEPIQQPTIFETDLDTNNEKPGLEPEQEKVEKKK